MLKSMYLVAARIPNIRPESGGLKLFDSFWTILNIVMLGVMAVCAGVLLLGIGKWVVGALSNNPSAGSSGMRSMLIALAGFILAGSFNAIVIFGMGLGLGA